MRVSVTPESRLGNELVATNLRAHVLVSALIYRRIINYDRRPRQILHQQPGFRAARNNRTKLAGYVDRLERRWPGANIYSSRIRPEWERHHLDMTGGHHAVAYHEFHA